MQIMSQYLRAIVFAPSRRLVGGVEVVEVGNLFEQCHVDFGAAPRHGEIPDYRRSPGDAKATAGVRTGRRNVQNQRERPGSRASAPIAAAKERVQGVIGAGAIGVDLA